MSEQHECEWYISGNGIPRCMVPSCGKALTIHQAESRLNEYETLTSENKAFRDEIASDNDELLGCVIEEEKLKDELETLKKATERLSAEGASRATRATEPLAWRDTTNILEGKDG